jgi:hypothetical protein
MGALKGDLSKLARLRDVIREVPRAIAEDVAKRGAPALTGELQGNYDSRRSAYGNPNPDGVDGKQLTLRKTGATDAALTFTAAGTTIKTPGFPRYMRFLIGKYRVLPNGNQAIPEAWRALLAELVRTHKPPAL